MVNFMWIYVIFFNQYVFVQRTLVWSSKMILQTCDFRDSFLRHRLPKTKEKNYSDLQNLDCSKKGLGKYINNKEKCWNSGGSTTGTLPILWVKYATSELGKYTTFTLQGDEH